MSDEKVTKKEMAEALQAFELRMLEMERQMGDLKKSHASEVERLEKKLGIFETIVEAQQVKLQEFRIKLIETGSVNSKFNNLDERLGLLEDSQVVKAGSPDRSRTMPNKVKRRSSRLLRSSAQNTAHTSFFGGTLDTIMMNQYALYPKETVPKVFTVLEKLLKDMNALKEQGIFRLSGSLNDIYKLKEMLNNGNFDITTSLIEKEFNGDHNVVACALKQWICELGDAIIPEKFHNQVIAAVQNHSVSAKDTMPLVYETIRDLPMINRNVLVAFCKLMKSVLANRSVNMMNEANLAICFAPGIFQESATDPMVYIKNSQMQTKWLENLLTYPPSEEDLSQENAMSKSLPVSPNRSNPTSPRKSGFSKDQFGVVVPGNLQLSGHASFASDSGSHSPLKSPTSKTPTERKDAGIQRTRSITVNSSLVARRRQSEPINPKDFPLPPVPEGKKKMPSQPPPLSPTSSDSAKE